MEIAAEPCLDVAKQLVALCREGKNAEAIQTLYADDIVSVEVMGDEEMPKEMHGLDAVLGKTRWWMDNHEVHAGETFGPFPHGDRFIVHFKYDVTPKIGPMAGQRITMQEAALYTAKDGKIVREEFFYDMTAPKS
ncbi:MAG: nuclear transport factor 2 family protein [Planctomycetota bacterium]